MRLNDMTELAGRVALVTGGSRGIGAAIARRLSRSGAAVALTYLGDVDAARRVAKQIETDGGRALTIQADNADPMAVTGPVERTVGELGRIDILVNNAATFAAGPLEQTTLDQVDRALAVNVRAVFLAAQAASRHMTAGGRIITIGTCLTERVPGPGTTLFAMTKAALTGLTKGLARDLGPRGITATVVHPGPIHTDSNPEDGPAADFMRGLTALGRYGTAEEIAATVAYLASDAARYITGTAIAVDGGFTA
jgi:3-oxoacyl-[acyl-carrier protein] reductase